MTRDQAALLEAKWRLGEITPTDLRELADELLTRGEDDQALIDLFALHPDELRWGGAEKFEALLRAWGGGRLSEHEAIRLFLRDLASGILNGSISPLHATTRAEVIWIRTNYQYDELGHWSDLNEELSYLGRSGLSYLGRDRASIEAEVIALARATVEGHS